MTVTEPGNRGNGLMVTRPRCEYMVDPVGIDVRTPRLSWEIISPKRATVQTAFQAVVSGSLSGLEAGTDILWDTGKVQSGESVHCQYGGPDLHSRRRYYWMVRIWDGQDEVSSWSEPAFWEMGLLEPADWKAKWVEPLQRPAQEEAKISFAEMESLGPGEAKANYDLLNPCQMLRREFTVKDGVRRARVYATAHGIYSLEVNGRLVGDREFAPEITSYKKYLQYDVYDVTEHVKTGSNAVGVTLADGWYAGRIGMMGDSCNYGNMLALLLQLEVEYADGSSQIVVSDDGFKSSAGPLVYSDLFIGERYDARLEKEGWSSPGYDDRGWTGVNVADYPFSNLVGRYGEPVRRVREIRPAGIIATPRGETVIDLGQVIAGRLRMRVRGARGVAVVLEHSEVLDEYGNFLMNIQGRNKDQKDIYVMRGAGEEIYEPRFTFHGFRYVRVTGYPGEVTVDDFAGVVLSSDLSGTGTFACSDPRIDQLQSNIVWSQRGNTLSIPTDCPQRERAGWTGDIQVFAPTACFNMDMEAFLTRWLRNLRIDQQDDGQVPIVVPYYRGYQELHKGGFGTDSSAGWGDAVIIVPWVLYNRYNDVRILEENYDAMKRWVAYIEKSAGENLPDNRRGDLSDEERDRQKYLWNTGFHFGDWLTPSVSIDLETGRVDMMKSARETSLLVPTCFYAYSTGLLSEIAGILGREEDRDYYTALNGKVREAFAGEFFHEDGRLAKHLQGMYVLALHMKMVPEGMQGRVFAQIVTLIEENGDKLDTGFLSTPFLMDVLCANGRKDIAYKLLYQTQCPSWLYEVEKGATTVWEAWQAILPDGRVTNVSYNHYAFGCIGDWLYRVVAGLDCDEPGYKHIVIKPEPDGKMAWARASYHSVYGEIVAGWAVRDGRMKLDVVIPPNTSASVYLPGAAGAEVTESGVNLPENRDIRSYDQRGDKAVVGIGSGAYVFEYPFSDYTRGR